MGGQATGSEPGADGSHDLLTGSSQGRLQAAAPIALRTGPLAAKRQLPKCPWAPTGLSPSTPARGSMVGRARGSRPPVETRMRARGWTRLGQTHLASPGWHPITHGETSISRAHFPPQHAADATTGSTRLKPDQTRQSQPNKAGTAPDEPYETPLSRFIDLHVYHYLAK